MKLPKSMSAGLSKNVSKSLGKFGKSTKSFAKATKSKTNDFVKKTGNKVKHKYKSFTDASSGDDSNANHRQSKGNYKFNKQRAFSGNTDTGTDTDAEHRNRHKTGRGSQKLKSGPGVFSAGYSEWETSGVTTTTTDVDTDTTDDYKVVHRERDSESSGGVQYKLFLVLLFLLATSSVIGLIFVPLGDRIAKRYSWYEYEAKVSTLIIAFGLAAASGLILVLLLLTQLKQLKRSNGNAFTIGIIAIGFIFSLIALICALVQRANRDSVFGEEFENLIPNYYTDFEAKSTLDTLQIEFECCGMDSWTDWSQLAMYDGDTNVPYSCCDPRALRPCLHERIEVGLPQIKYKYPDDLTIYQNGCRPVMQEFYSNFILIALSLSSTYVVLETIMFIVGFLNCK